MIQTSLISIVAGMSATTTLVLQAKMNSAGVNSAIIDATFTLKSTDGKVWTCSNTDVTGTAIDNRYLPSACR